MSAACDGTAHNVSHRIALSLPVITLKVTRVRHVVPLAIGSLRITHSHQPGSRGNHEVTQSPPSPRFALRDDAFKPRRTIQLSFSPAMPVTADHVAAWAKLQPPKGKGKPTPEQVRLSRLCALSVLSLSLASLSRAFLECRLVQRALGLCVPRRPSAAARAGRSPRRHLRSAPSHRSAQSRDVARSRLALRHKLAQITDRVYAAMVTRHQVTRARYKPRRDRPRRPPMVAAAGASSRSAGAAPARSAPRSR